MIKRICAILIALSALHCVSLSVYAIDTPVEREDCSIEITIRYNGENINSGTLTAIKVGYIKQEDNNYFFCQEMTNERLKNIQSPEAPNIQKEFYENNIDNYNFYTQTKPIINGKATFTELSTGLYLIVQNDRTEGFYKVGSSLVSIPYYENSEYKYHVSMSIKPELEQEPSPIPPQTTEPDRVLPQTGQLQWPIPLMSLVGVVLFLMGGVLCFGKKGEQHEK